MKKAPQPEKKKSAQSWPRSAGGSRHDDPAGSYNGKMQWIPEPETETPQSWDETRALILSPFEFAAAVYLLTPEQDRQLQAICEQFTDPGIAIAEASAFLSQVTTLHERRETVGMIRDRLYPASPTVPDTRLALDMNRAPDGAVIGLVRDANGRQVAMIYTALDCLCIDQTQVDASVSTKSLNLSPDDGKPRVGVRMRFDPTR